MGFGFRDIYLYQRFMEKAQLPAQIESLYCSTQPTKTICRKLTLGTKFKNYGY